MTLVSVRYAEGITFTEDDTTNRLRAYGLCVTTGSGIAYSQTRHIMFVLTASVNASLLHACTGR